MKTFIVIYGEKSGNMALRGAISGAERVIEGSKNSSCAMVFPGMEEARNALYRANDELREFGHKDLLQYAGDCIVYDCAKAEIL